MDVDYAVELLGFARKSKPEAAEALAQMFQVPIDLATRFVENTPVVVRKHATAAEAEAYRMALRGIGAGVRIRTVQVAKPTTPQDRFHEAALDSDLGGYDDEPENPTVQVFRPQVAERGDQLRLPGVEIDYDDFEQQADDLMESDRTNPVIYPPVTQK